MAKIIVPGEPQIVTDTRELILDTFKDLIFIEEGHKYFLHGQELPSVSGVTHQFKPEFDSETVATNYAKKHGQTKEYWLDQWLFKNLKATKSGTIFHEFGEGMFWLSIGCPERMPVSSKQKYYKENNWMIPTGPKEDAILKFHREMSQYDFPVLAETKVYNNFNPNVAPMRTSYCGTFDILYYRYFPNDPGASGFVIKDYKTNRELTNDYNRSHGKNCLAPFADLPDESLSMYILQLSCYQIPLEDLGLKVIDREIIWLKDDGNYELIHLPDFTGRLRSAL